MADSDTQPVTEQVTQPVTAQVTSIAPITKPAKNPNRVKAGKATAEKTRQAREARKKRPLRRLS